MNAVFKTPRIKSPQLRLLSATGEWGNCSQVPARAHDNAIVDLASIFERENNLTLLSARATAGNNSDKMLLMRQNLRTGHWPLDANGNPLAPEELAKLPLSNLVLIFRNTPKTIQPQF